MYFDTDEEMVQVRAMFPIFGAPDTPLYRQQWPTTLPASFFDDLSNHPPAVQNYKIMSDSTYGRIPMARRDMWHEHVNYYLVLHKELWDVQFVMRLKYQLEAIEGNM